MSLEECTEETTVSNVKVEELKRKAIFRNPNHDVYRKIQVDGCVIKQGIRADCAVEKDGVGTVIIEFKGRDLEHAADQVAATTRYWVSTLKTKLPIAGLIIGAQFPKSPAGFQKKQAAYAKEFKAPLRAVNKEGVFTFEDLFEFR